VYFAGLSGSSYDSDLKRKEEGEATRIHHEKIGWNNWAELASYLVVPSKIPAKIAKGIWDNPGDVFSGLLPFNG
jgi:hypothetical protein